MKNCNKVNVEMQERWNKRQTKRSIHTTLKPSTINKLEEYGDGKLNMGIETVLEIAESRQNNVREQLFRIASQIIAEDVGIESNLN
ncbi:MAG: hypothetical protein P1P80_00930 [ANME-2 cluster archaeon]|nr:hypothetical protein [ANME-2 cluster archaeon]